MADTKSSNGQPGSGAESLWQSVCHDFRQPVQSLELLASAMASARTDEARRRCAERAADLAASLRAMIEGLTQVSRLEAGELVAAPVVVPMAGAVRSAIQALGPHGDRIVPRRLAGNATTAPAMLAASLEGLLLYSMKFADTDPVTVATRASKREAVIEIGFDGSHPRSALTSLAFVEAPRLTEAGAPRSVSAPSSFPVWPRCWAGSSSSSRYPATPHGFGWSCPNRPCHRRRSSGEGRAGQRHRQRLNSGPWQLISSISTTSI